MIAEVIHSSFGLSKFHDKCYLKLYVNCDGDMVYVYISLDAPFFRLLCKQCNVAYTPPLRASDFNGKLISVVSDKAIFKDGDKTITMLNTRALLDV